MPRSTGPGWACGARAARIAAIGPGVAPAPGDEVLDAGGQAIVPGFVNAHTHAGMTLFRGFADDLPLMEWLEQHIWPVEKRMSDEDVYWGTRLACLEMIRTGTTSFWDMYWHADAAARAVEDAGIRAVTAAPLIDDADPAKSDRACADAERSLERIAEAGGALRPARVRPARDLLGQREVAAAARGASAGTRRAGPDPPVRDAAGGRGVRRGARGPPGAVPRSSAGCSARTRSSPTGSGWTSRSSS